jgi:TrmH family RNA methyltransferase
MQHSFKHLASSHNDTVKQLAKLMQQGRERRQQGVMVLEGIHLCEAGLQSGWGFEQVFVNLRAQTHPEITQLLSQLPALAQRYTLDDSLLSKVSARASAPEMLAVCRRPVPAAPAATDSRLLLEDIQDPGNLGTILRSAAASGVNQVFLSAGCVDVYSPKVLRAGMGAHFALMIHEQADLLAELQGFNGIRLVTSLAGDRSLYAQDLRAPVAFVFGNEGAGVSAALHAAADAKVRIPMPGRAESLNVAMAATLCLFERVRQLECARDA